MVYPRVGGETQITSRGAGSGLGLSPRGRGNRHVAPLAMVVEGSIPAWAGKPRPGHVAWNPRRVYPRVGGETTRG